MYIIDRIEHGNGGVCNIDVLDELPLDECLQKRPSDYGVLYKEWGFWPVISESRDIKNYVYYWNDDEETWERV